LIRDFERLKYLISRYKKEIGEDDPDENGFSSLFHAIEAGQIIFYAAKDEGSLIGMCSVSEMYSTFAFRNSGVFEDFYILPEYRKQGIAKMLTAFVFEECRKAGLSSILVGCSDTDLKMYRRLGFEVRLGQLLCRIF
jgi:GNAT superfamily N-acetyltransferase